MKISLDCAATSWAAANAPATASASAAAFVLIMRFMCFLLLVVWRSVRKWPHPQLLLADRPQPREAMRLDDEEEDERAPKIMNSMFEIIGVDSGMPRYVGSWFSTSGRITMKAAPRNDPRIEPRPPMITMKSSWNERFTSKARGSQLPSRMKAQSAPAMPMKNELTANAESFARIGRIPITSAATSMSRVAIHERPIAPRVRLRATSAPRHTNASTKRYCCAGVTMV